MLVFWFGNSIKKIILTKIFKNFSSDEYLQQSICLKEITTLLETVNKLIQLKKKKKEESTCNSEYRNSRKGTRILQHGYIFACLPS